MAKADESVSVEWVVDRAAVFLGLEPADLKTASARSKYREAWRIAAYAAWEVSGRSTPEIGRVMGGQDHSSVIWAREKVKAQMAVDPKFRSRVAKLLEDLRIALF